MGNLRQILRGLFEWWSGLWEAEPEFSKHHITALVLRVLSILIPFVVFDRGIWYVTRLPVEHFYEPVIVLGFAKHLLTHWFGLALIPALLILFLLRDRLFFKWQDLPHSSGLRILILVCTGLLAWQFSTYDYNLLFDRYHYFDRLLLIALAICVFWRPVFVFLFIPVLLVIASQFLALDGYSFATTYLLTRILELFGIFVVLYALTRKFSITDFVLLSGSMIAAFYWTPGIAKLTWAWVAYDRLYLILPGSYTNGWAAFLRPETVTELTRFLEHINLPMKLFTLVAECGSILFFWKRNVARFLTAAWITFHLGVFLTSGIFFWAWILLDLSLLWLLISRNGFADLPVFRLPHLAVSVALVVSGPIWCRPVQLAWYEIPVSYHYRFEAQAKDGRVYQLTPAYFSPYNYQFTLGAGFGFVSQFPAIASNGGGTTDFETFLKVNDFTTSEQVFAAEKSLGSIAYNPEATKKLDQFVKTFVRNWNRRHSNATWLSYLQPPRLLWTYPTLHEIRGPIDIETVTIVRVTGFFGKNGFERIGEVDVHTIEIEDQ